MPPKLKVYLAGPITGCNDEQRRWWRDEIRRRLGSLFVLEDPMDWIDDRVSAREPAKMEACDIVIANMWKESIGTTLGIIRACQQGKTVIVIDPNRLHNPILETLVHPETHVHSVDEACERLKRLAEEFRPFVVVKNDGSLEDFAPRKVARSVQSACAAAGVSDPALEHHITGPVIARVRLVGGQRGSITAEEIRHELFDRIEAMRTDFSLPGDFRSRCQEIASAWEKHEREVNVEQTVRAAEARAEEAGWEAVSWKTVARELQRRLDAVPDASTAEVQPEPEPAFRSVDKVIKEVTRKYGAFLIFHDEAKSSARKLKMTSRGLEQLNGLLVSLGEFAKDRAFAQEDGTPPPRFEEHFGENYAPTESHETKERYRSPTYKFQGRIYRGLQHLKMTDDRGARIRVYFEEISTAQFLVCEIGHRETFLHDG